MSIRARTILLGITTSWSVLAMTSVLQLVQIPIALRALEDSEFALFAVFSQFLNAVTLFDFGIPAAFTRLLIGARIDGREAYARLWHTGLVVIGLQALCMLVPAIAIMPFISGLFNVPANLQTTALRVFACLALLFAARHAVRMFGVTLFAANRLPATNITQGTTMLVQFVVFVIAIRAGMRLWAYPLSIAAGVVTSLAVGWVLCFVYRLLPHRSARGITPADVKSLMAFGLDMFAWTLFGLVSNAAPIVLAGMVLPHSQVVRLSIYMKPLQLLLNAAQRIHAACIPSLSEYVSSGHMGQYRRLWRLLAKASLAVALGMTALYAAWSPHLVRWWTGRPLPLSLTATILLSWLPVRQSLHLLFVETLYCFKALSVVRLPLVLETVALVAVSLGLGALFGTTGLLLGPFVSLAAGTIVRGGRYMFATAGFTPKGKRLTIPGTALIVLGLLAVAFPVMVVDAGVWMLLSATGTLLVVAAVVFLRWGLTDEDRNRLLAAGGSPGRRLARLCGSQRSVDES